MKKAHLRFPVFFSLARRRVSPADFDLLLALMPRIAKELEANISIASALERASPTNSTLLYAIMLDLAHGRWTFEPASPRRASDAIAHRLATLRHLERELRRISREARVRPVEAPTPFVALEKLL